MAKGRELAPADELLEAFEQCGRVTEYLLSVIPAQIWESDPPAGRGRSIRTIAAHMHSVRRTFARMGGARGVAPPLGRKAFTKADVERALGRTNAALTALFRTHLAEGHGRIKGMPRRTVNMIAYLMQHDAHHRGQIASLARDLGHEFTGDDVMRMWGWKKME